MRASRVLVKGYAKYHRNFKFYHMGQAKATSAYGVHNRDVLRKPSIDEKFSGKRKGADEVVDMRDKERLDDAEAMRHPKERDFYQDHTYHEGWIQRNLDTEQKNQIKSMFQWMKPGNVKEPWLWYPQDTVEVVKGSSAGARGLIIAVVKYKNEIIVQNVNVKDVVIPATESRPEQIVQREHPISVDEVMHVCPSSNELTEVRLVKVRNKETGELEQKRICMASGVILPVPDVHASDEVTSSPLHDTPYGDALEETYEAKEEIGVLVQRKLRAMEDHFIEQLKASHEFHEPLMKENAKQMKTFQKDVVELADQLLVHKIASNIDLKEQWWNQEVEGIIDEHPNVNEFQSGESLKKKLIRQKKEQKAAA